MSKSRFIFAAFIMILSVVSSTLSALPVSNVAAESFPNLAGKKIDQVIAGYDSACAVIDSWAYCWGANNFGQLGNGTRTASSTTPVAVSKDKLGKPAGPNVCTATFLGIFCTAWEPEYPAVAPSALVGKDVEKVAVGKTHACALAQASVYCWGDNSHGQLGNRTTTSMSLAPVKIDTQGKDVDGKPKSALGQKEVVDIAAGEFFTCALASDGSVACWGEGDNGRLGTNSTTDVNYPKAVYAAGVMNGKKSIKLAKVGGATMCALTVNSAVFSTSAENGNPYCWGMGVGKGVVPAATYVKCSRTTGPTTTNTSSTTPVYFDALQPVDSTGMAGLLKDVEIVNSNQITGISDNGRPYYWGLHGYIRKEVSNGSQSGTGCTYTVTTTTGSGGLNSTGGMCGGGGNHGSPGCGSSTVTKTVRRYDVQTTYVPTGSVTTLGPLYVGPTTDSPLNQKGLRVTSGNALSGLFCAVPESSSAGYCDAHGLSVKEGQTGSNYTEHCVTTGILSWTKTKCDPAPTGAQQVFANGWLSGKSIDQLSTGGTGFTCALANNQIGCWGVNSVGQLGTGNKANKNVPTALKLQ